MKLYIGKFTLTYYIVVAYSLGLNAQTPIDITSEHSKLGRDFASLVWRSADGATMSLPSRETLPTGKKGEYLKVTFKKPIDKWVFRRFINGIINTCPDMENVTGGWTDEDGKIITLINLNAKDLNRRASCLLVYNEINGVVVFSLWSTHL